MKKSIFFAIAATVLSVPVIGQIIHTVAGPAGVCTSLQNPISVAVDTAGNIFVGDSKIYEINPGITTCTAIATLGSSNGMCTDRTGNIYVTCQSSQEVVKINHTTHAVTVIAGNGSSGYNGDNIQATAAWLHFPVGVAVDTLGNVYIADQDNNRVRKVTVSTGKITTVLGNGVHGSTGDGGQATAAEVGFPAGVAIDKSGNIYVTDDVSNNVRMVNVSNGIVTDFAGKGIAGFKGDHGLADSAEFNSPYGLTFDKAGNLYVADMFNQRIRKINTHDTIITIAGKGQNGYLGDEGLADSGKIASPLAVAADKNGNVYIADNSQVIRMVTKSTGIITSIAGYAGVYRGDAWLALANADYGAHLGLDFDKNNTLFVADPFTNILHKINTVTGRMTIVSSDALGGGFGGDGGLAIYAGMYRPIGIAVDTAENIYFCDNQDNRIREIKGSTGIINTVAGNGASGYTGDGGPATAAELSSPEGISTDLKGNFYFGDWNFNIVRKVDISTGIITTIAGRGIYGYGGDGGQATNAFLAGPTDIKVDKTGNIYILDGDNNRVRKVTASTGIITTIAGGGASLLDGVGATSEQLIPQGIALDTADNLFITDQLSDKVKMVDGITNIITTVAGNGTAGFSGDGGPAIAAELNQPDGIGVSKTGTLYFYDRVNLRIRAFNIGITTETGELYENKTIEVFPNPFSNSTTIVVESGKYKVESYLELYDLTGQKLKQIEFSGNTYTLSAEGLAKGMYFIRIFDKDKNVIGTSKIVVQ